MLQALHTGRLSLLQRSESKELKQENLSRCAQKNSFGALQQQVSFRSGAFRSRYTIYVGTRHRVLSPLLSAGRGPLLTLRLLEPAPHKDEVFCTPSAAPARCAMAAPTIRRLVVARIMALVGVLIKAQAVITAGPKKAGDQSRTQTRGGVRSIHCAPYSGRGCMMFFFQTLRHCRPRRTSFFSPDEALDPSRLSSGLGVS